MKTALAVLATIGPEDANRMDWEDIAVGINEVLKRNSCTVPEIGECYRTAMKKILAGILRLEKDSCKLAALEAGGVDNWDFYYDSLKDNGFFEEYPEG
jgi:hypothetical protein